VVASDPPLLIPPVVVPPVVVPPVAIPPVVVPPVAPPVVTPPLAAPPVASEPPVAVFNGLSFADEQASGTTREKAVKTARAVENGDSGIRKRMGTPAVNLQPKFVEISVA
jgi:hypothetical protein